MDPSASLVSSANGSTASDDSSVSSDHRPYQVTYNIQTLNYASEIPHVLICPICREVLVQPIQLPCEHVFCHGCVDTYFSLNPDTPSTCPMCRNPINAATEIKAAPNMIQEILDNLVVRCPRMGCQEQVRRSVFQDHVDNNCGGRLVPCPDETCNLYIQQRLSRHGCLHKIVHCEFCAETVTRLRLQDHLCQCALGPVQCPYCLNTFHRVDFHTHLQNGCDGNTQWCIGKKFGCTFNNIDQLVREHERTCTIAMMTPHLERQREQAAAEMAHVVARLEEQAQAIKELTHVVRRLEIKSKRVEHRHDADAAAPVVPPTPSDILSSQQSSSSQTGRLEHELTDQRQVINAHANLIEELQSIVGVNIGSDMMRHDHAITELSAGMMALRIQLNTLIQRQSSPVAHETHISRTNSPSQFPDAPEVRSIHRDRGDPKL